MALLKGLPNAMTVAAWRHVAIAFGRKYLGGELVEELTIALEQDDYKDDTIDLMAGHSSQVADIHYAREMEGGTKFDEFFSLGYKVFKTIVTRVDKFIYVAGVRAILITPEAIQNINQVILDEAHEILINDEFQL
ncbi:hypothetical protein L209DRAFT_744831 [Thermothelomyces heterothallicus CBS 203.75]